MPKILSYTPSWLSRPNPGFQVFNGPQSSYVGRYHTDKRGDSGAKIEEFDGPNRTIAHRGAEIFVVVGAQIRWADLSLLKEGFEQLEATPSKGPRAGNGHTEEREDGPDDGSYRVRQLPPASFCLILTSPEQILKAGSIHGQIRQLSVSPNGKFLAIATSHTVHLAILPDSSHLGQLPNRPIKLKTSTIGRTIHVVSQSSIARILWHPCGLSGNCLVTVTTDAVIRLWEFDEGNRYASDTPSLAIDLKKLALGTSEHGDFAPERGRNRAFSSDSVGMEVASACFGGTGSSDESSWSAMTLWIAMRAGDIYALCPLSPSKWQAPSTMLPSLSTTAVAKGTAVEEEGAQDTQEMQQYRDQYTWIRELDGQEPTYIEDGAEFGNGSQVFRRPEHPSPIPKLQGPFQLTSEEIYGDARDEDDELSDIYVIASQVDRESLDIGEGSDCEPDVDEHDLSAALICLATKSGKVYVCLDPEGVEAQWLPRKKPIDQPKPPLEPYLVLLEVLDTLKPHEADDFEWPTFSPDVDSRYSFFTTHSQGVFFFSFDPWLQNLEKELQSADSTGLSFRIDVFKHGPGTLRERILSFNQESSLEECSTNPVPSCIALEDSDLGYFLLTSHNHRPEAATLDRPYPPSVHDLEPAEDEDPLPDMNTLAIGPTRSAYQPASAFYSPSEVVSFIDRKVPARHKHLLSQQIRLSPATLDLMTESHRILSRETHRLGVAAADLFRRCERLIEELKDQIGRVQECAMRTDNVLDAGEKVQGKEEKLYLEERVQMIQERQVMLQERHEALKRKLHGAGGKNLSEKEKAWGREVERTDEAIREQTGNGRPKQETDEDSDAEDEGEYGEETDDEEEDEHHAKEKLQRTDTGVLKKRLEQVWPQKDEFERKTYTTCRSTTSEIPFSLKQTTLPPPPMRRCLKIVNKTIVRSSYRRISRRRRWRKSWRY